LSNLVPYNQFDAGGVRRLQAHLKTLRFTDFLGERTAGQQVVRNRAARGGIEGMGISSVRKHDGYSLNNERR
jgi:hypothetical protein